MVARGGNANDLQEAANAELVDCDVHPHVPTTAELLPYLDVHWKESVLQRGFLPFEPVGYPRNAPITCRDDWKLPADAPADAALQMMREKLLDRFGVTIAICNCLYGVQILQSEDMAAGFARAVNDWLVDQWLDKEERLRGSIVVPMQNPELAVEEIERCAKDDRFVQVLMLVMGEMPLGKRYYWPIYEAAHKANLPVALHAGSMYRHAVTGIGWPSYHAQDYFSQATAFQTQLTSLVCEGVFSAFPDLKFVLSESGFTWLPSYLWRLDKYWHGLRMEVPWVDRLPSEIVASNIRFTLQPLDTPPTAEDLERVFAHVGCDDLVLFSSDYPHWQFDADNAVPEGIPAATKIKIRAANSLATYPRLRALAS